MKQKPFIKKYGLAIVLLLAVALVAAYLSMNKNTDNSVDSADQEDSQLTQKTPGEPQFAFTGAEGWWQGATDHVSMALFQESEQSCFVSAEYRSGAIADGKSDQDANNKSLADQGYTVVASPSKSMELQTASGSVDYQLEQTNITTPDGAQDVKGGLATGFVDVPSDGYVYVMANCDEPSQLDDTYTALQAIKFEPTE